MMTKLHPQLALFSALSLLASSLLYPGTIHAQPANEPIDNFLVTDGVVNTMVVRSNVLYVGGKFTQAGVSSGGGLLVSTATGLPRPLPPGVKGTANVSVQDGSGGWFTGGNSPLVGTTLCSNLVHFRSDFSIDTNWHPVAVGGSVSAMYLSGGILYIGGLFTNVNGLARNRLAALDATTGALIAWNPNANDQVSALFVQGTNCYCGGYFTVIGSTARSHIACISTISGTPTVWDPSANDLVDAFISVSNRLFVGGNFTTIASQSRTKLASFDLGTGVIDSWSPAMAGSTVGSPTVYGLANYGSNILVAGIFTSLGTSNRVNVGAVDMTTGFATAWDAGDVFLSNSGFPVSYAGQTH